MINFLLKKDQKYFIWRILCCLKTKIAQEWTWNFPAVWNWDFAAVLFEIWISLIGYPTFTSYSFWICGPGWEYVNLMVKTRLYGHSCAAHITLRKLPILCQIMAVLAKKYYVVLNVWKLSFSHGHAICCFLLPGNQRFIW